MKFKLVIKIAAGVVLVIDGAKRLMDFIRDWKKFKKISSEDPNWELMMKFESFKAECEKNNILALQAVRMMNELTEELDKKMGVDPTTISIELSEV